MKPIKSNNCGYNIPWTNKEKKLITKIINLMTEERLDIVLKKLKKKKNIRKY